MSLPSEHALGDEPGRGPDGPRPDPEYAVELRGIKKSFGESEVLSGVDLGIRPKTRLAVIGPSGSGKSTLLRLLMTLERPTEGVIMLNGESLWSMQRRGREVPANEAHLRRMRNSVGFVFQHFNLFPHMSVLQNMTLAPVHVLSLSEDDAVSRARKLLELVGLSDKEDAHPTTLSGGQQQRVAIARALAMEPAVMLFDEVTSSLDPELVAEVLAVIRGLAEQDYVTMLIVTHEMRFARQVADWVAFLDEGRIVEQGPPASVLEQPQVARTKQFLRLVEEAS